MISKKTKDLVDAIEKAADDLADELAAHPDGGKRFRYHARNLKKLALELVEREDG